MPSTLYDVELWLEYAEQMRAIGAVATDPLVRQHTLDIAARFKRIATLAEKLRSGGEKRRRWKWAA